MYLTMYTTYGEILWGALCARVRTLTPVRLIEAHLLSVLLFLCVISVAKEVSTQAIVMSATWQPWLEPYRCILIHSKSCTLLKRLHHCQGSSVVLPPGMWLWCHLVWTEFNCRCSWYPGLAWHSLGGSSSNYLLGIESRRCWAAQSHARLGFHREEEEEEEKGWRWLLLNQLPPTSVREWKWHVSTHPLTQPAACPPIYSSSHHHHHDSWGGDLWTMWPLIWEPSYFYFSGEGSSHQSGSSEERTLAALACAVMVHPDTLKVMYFAWRSRSGQRLPLWHLVWLLVSASLRSVLHTTPVFIMSNIYYQFVGAKMLN